MSRGEVSGCGFKGTGADVELTLVRETERAYLVEVEGEGEAWLPKSAFTEDGMLLSWGARLLEEKLGLPGRGGWSDR